jgi:hypothetical protein
MPWDLVLFAVVVVGFFVIGLPRIVGTIHIPAEVELQEVPEYELTDRQRIFFEAVDSKLSAMGYSPAITYRAVNMQGHNLLRTYLSDSDYAIITLTLLRSEIENAEDQSTHYLEVITRFADGALAITRNAELSEVLEFLPDQFVQDLRGVREPSELKARHDRRLESFQLRSAVQLRRDDLFDRFREFHSRWCEHQVAQGLMRYDGDVGLYRLTTRTGLRGIRNYLNPLADNFTWRRMVAAVVLGSILPALAVAAVRFPQSPVRDWLLERLGLADNHLLWLACGVAFTIAGSAVGAIFSAKAFIWSFILAYVPLRLLGPAGLLPLWFSLWTGFVAHRVSSWRMRRHELV